MRDKLAHSYLSSRLSLDSERDENTKKFSRSDEPKEIKTSR